MLKFEIGCIICFGIFSLLSFWILSIISKEEILKKEEENF